MMSDQAYIALIILLGVALLLSMFKVAVRLMHTIKEVDSQSPSACTTPRFTRRTPPAFHLASLAEKQGNCQVRTESSTLPSFKNINLKGT